MGRYILTWGQLLTYVACSQTMYLLIVVVSYLAVIRHSYLQFHLDAPYELGSMYSQTQNCRGKHDWVLWVWLWCHHLLLDPKCLCWEKQVNWFTLCCSIGSILCSIQHPVRVTTRFEARVIVFNIEVPITIGYPVSQSLSVPVLHALVCAQVVLHYQSLSEPAVIKKLISLLNKTSGELMKKRPRYFILLTTRFPRTELVCIFFHLFKKPPRTY